jgi:uncharacterized membrane protein
LSVLSLPFGTVLAIGIVGPVHAFACGTRDESISALALRGNTTSIIDPRVGFGFSLDESVVWIDPKRMDEKFAESENFAGAPWLLGAIGVVSSGCRCPIRGPTPRWAERQPPRVMLERAWRSNPNRPRPAVSAFQSATPESAISTPFIRHRPLRDSMASSDTNHGARNSINDYLRQTLLTGTAIVLPVLITAFVFLLIVDLLSGLLNPLVLPIQEGLGIRSRLVPQLISLVVLVLTIFFVGAITESRFGGDRLKESLDATIARIPGIRSIYGPLDQISTMLVEGDTQNFQEVVLVEFPNEGSYSLAFQTSHPPEKITKAAQEDDMLTVFMPMGPNPFMGGFILHLPETDVHSVDLSVEEGLSSIVSFGVAVETDPRDSDIPLDVQSPERNSS